MVLCFHDNQSIMASVGCWTNTSDWLMISLREVLLLSCVNTHTLKKMQFLMFPIHISYTFLITLLEMFSLLYMVKKTLLPKVNH